MQLEIGAVRATRDGAFPETGGLDASLRFLEQVVVRIGRAHGMRRHVLEQVDRVALAMSRYVGQRALVAFHEPDLKARRRPRRVTPDPEAAALNDADSVLR